MDALVDTGYEKMRQGLDEECEPEFLLSFFVTLIVMLMTRSRRNWSRFGSQNMESVFKRRGN